MDTLEDKSYINGGKVAKLRLEQGKSQEQLSNESNVSRSQIQRIENGIQKDAKIGTITKLAEALKTPVEQLIL